MLRLPLQFVVISFAIALGAGQRCLAETANSLAEDRAELFTGYRQKLSELANWCDENKLADEAREVRAWLPKRNRDKIYLFVLDPTGNANNKPAANSQDASDSNLAREFRSRWQKLRVEQAAALLALARRAAEAHQPSMAVELVTEAAREDADCKPAWRLLGYVKHAGAWRTPFEVKQLGEGKVWSDRFGWIPEAHQKSYAAGQRFYRNRWMKADEETRLRREKNDPWHVETDHYLVTTGDSLEEGVSLARRLEQLYSVWQQVFAGYLTTSDELARRLAKGDPPRNRDGAKHQVVYYRSRDEYNQALRSSQPQIGMTLGIYVDKVRTAYFFADEDQEPTTLLHEATHQLFQETRPTAKNVGRDDNFWIIEAVACYMESLVEHAGYWTLGGADEGRMAAARHRLLKDNFYIPLAELVALGMQGVQRHADIAKLYSESAGLAAFLLSRHLEATVEYLESVYNGHADRDTLASLTGRTYAELDADYRAFVEKGRPAEANSEFGDRNSEVRTKQQ